MLKVILLAVLFDANSGEVLSVISPPPAYETMEQCLAAAKTLPKPSAGFGVKTYCLAPGDLQT